MITVELNKINNSIDFSMDRAGINLLLDKLNELKSEYEHVHIYATGDNRGLSLKAIHVGSEVFGEIILELCPSEDWVVQQ